MRGEVYGDDGDQVDEFLEVFVRYTMYGLDRLTHQEFLRFMGVIRKSEDVEPVSFGYLINVVYRLFMSF